MADPLQGPSRPWWRRAGRDGAELLGLAGFAVTQPLLDVYGRAPEVFVFERASRLDIVLFAVAVAAGPATGLWVVGQAAGLVHARAGRVAHVGAVVLLVALLALQVLGHLGAEGALAVGGAALLTVLAAVAYLRLEVVGRWLRYAAVASLAFLGLFLGASPVADLLASQEVAAAEVTATAPRSIVMIIWDEWPLSTLVDAEGRIDADLYPNLAALAGDGAWFRNATGVSNGTAFAVPAVLTGRHPPRGSVSGIASEYPENLFTLLATQYDLDVIESYTMLCPPNLCDGRLVDHPDDPDGPAAPGEPGAGDDPAPAPTDGRGDRPLATLLGQARGVYRTILRPGDGRVSVLEEATVTAETRAANPADAVAIAGAFDAEAAGDQGVFPAVGLASVDQLIESIEPGEGPTLHFAHMQLPHSPYRFLPSRQEYARPPSLEDNEMLAWTMGERPPAAPQADVDRQRAILQGAYADALLGDVVDRLRDTGLYEDSIIVMTSDHGAGFVPGQATRGLGLGVDDALDPSLHPDLLYVPLVIKGPGLAPGTVRDDNVMTVDVVPTLAELIGLELPWPVDGISLVSGEREDPEKSYRIANLTLGGQAEVEGAAGERHTYDGAAAFASMLDRHTGTVLADVAPDLRPYALAGDGDLVGSALTDLVDLTDGTDAGTDAGPVALEVPDAFTDVDPTEPLPLLLVGGVDAPQPDPLRLAFSLNGVVAGVATTYQELEAPHAFRTVLWPGPLQPGGNDLTVWQVVGQGDGRRLAPLGLR